ncbi:MAG: LacI family DNA-binding transcriptional regulator [Saprospiraceae bacterium]
MNKEREVTIYDIADNLNLSIATVSRALKNDPVVNKKTKKKITDLAEKLGYRTNHFAKNLRTQKTNTIGVIIPRLNSYFMSTVIAGMEAVANKAGYNLIISQSAETFEKEIESAGTMFNNRVDGLLVSLAYETKNLDHFNQFLNKKIPLIFFDRAEDQESFANIVLDNAKAGFDATEHLIKQGCRRIVHLTANSVRDTYSERLRGYQNAYKQYGIPFDEHLILRGNLSMEFGREAANKIMAMPQRPDGIFAANDNSAVGCMIHLKSEGVRIPEDIAIVGFNNDPISIVIEPNLTTINYPGYEMGELAAGHLISHLSGSQLLQKTKSILLHHELLIRKSSIRI